MLRNKSIFIILILLQLNVSAQLIEAESRPYRFKIDMMMEIEEHSASKAFEIIPYKIQISDLLEKELADWYKNNGFSSSESEQMDAMVVGKIDEILPNTVQLVGSNALGNSEMRCFFIEESLQFDIQINAFKSFKIAIPLAEVESFKNNFEQIKYSNQQIALNNDHEFVVTYIHLYNSSNKKKYIFYNTEDESVQAPNFSISLPKTDL